MKIVMTLLKKNYIMIIAVNFFLLSLVLLVSGENFSVEKEECVLRNQKKGVCTIKSACRSAAAKDEILCYTQGDHVYICCDSSYVEVLDTVQNEDEFESREPVRKSNSDEIVAVNVVPSWHSTTSGDFSSREKHSIRQSGSAQERKLENDEFASKETSFTSEDGNQSVLDEGLYSTGSDEVVRQSRTSKEVAYDYESSEDESVDSTVSTADKFFLVYPGDNRWDGNRKRQKNNRRSHRGNGNGRGNGKASNEYYRPSGGNPYEINRTPQWSNQFSNQEFSQQPIRPTNSYGYYENESFNQYKPNKQNSNNPQSTWNENKDNRPIVFGSENYNYNSNQNPNYNNNNNYHQNRPNNNNYNQRPNNYNNYNSNYNSNNNNNYNNNNQNLPGNNYNTNYNNQNRPNSNNYNSNDNVNYNRPGNHQNRPTGNYNSNADNNYNKPNNNYNQNKPNNNYNSNSNINFNNNQNNNNRRPENNNNRWTTERPRTTTSRVQSSNYQPQRPSNNYNNNNNNWSSGSGQKRISEIKCDEYAAPVTEVIAGLPLTPDPKPVKVNVQKCIAAQQLIVGGENTTVGEFPHMAAIGFPDRNKPGGIGWYCGGSLISDKFVMTAAHCTSTPSGKPVKVRLGEYNLYKNDDGAHPEDYSISEIIKHPEYKPPSKYNDIALLRLSRGVDFKKHIRPACLQVASRITEPKATAIGWGRVYRDEKPSEVLLKVSLSLIDSNTCNRAYQSNVKKDVLPRGIVDTQMCAGELAGGKDTCQGDSGGPIEVRSKQNQCVHYVVGVTSFGKHCAQPNAPGVYTRVSAYVPWIESVVWPRN